MENSPLSNNEIKLLNDLLNDYENGLINETEKAFKCYLSEKEKETGRTTWIHVDELANHVLLRNMAKNGTKDLLRQTKEKL